MFIGLLILNLLVLDVLWWKRMHRMLHSSMGRILLGLFMGGQVLFLLWNIGRVIWARGNFYWPPMAITAAGYIWHLLLLPLAWVYLLAADRVARLYYLRRKPEADPPGDVPTRRQFIGSVAAAAVPPLLDSALAGAALHQLGTFRIRHFNVPLRGLPASLDGLSIAHVSDVHVGRFTTEPMLDEIVQTVNRLRPELILCTGDLINLSLSELPAAFHMLRRLQAPGGVFLCEGNHDLIPGRKAFETAVKQAGFSLLLDESYSLRLRGEGMQIMGLRWNRGQAEIDQSIARVAAQRRSHEFPILLAHHPHAFDPAARAELPLTLSGHTHGGQLMLTENIGFGPAMFRYWTGLYRKGNSALVVSNGVGNWFPLRLHAPAEIIHLTLRRV